MRNTLAKHNSAGTSPLRSYPRLAMVGELADPSPTPVGSPNVAECRILCVCRNVVRLLPLFAVCAWSGYLLLFLGGNASGVPTLPDACGAARAGLALPTCIPQAQALSRGT